MAAVKKCLVVCMLCIVSMGLTGCADNPKQVLNDTIDAAHGLKDIVDGNQDYLEVYTCAKEAIKQQLDCPATAVFPPYGDGTVTSNSSSMAPMGNEFYVKSYVDTENFVGAKIRLNFELILYREDGNWVYELVDLQ